LLTLEERLSMLEESFGTSIRELNENGTILLGLFQTQLQETKQTRVSVEFMKIRMDMLETKVNANTALLNEHTRVLGTHTKILGEHTILLNEHSRVLGEHTALLNEHTTRFDRLEGMLTQVLERLPEKP